MAVVSRGCVLWEERGQKELLEAYFELIPTLQVFLGKSGAFLKTLVKKIKKKGKASYLSYYGTIAPGDRRLHSHSKDPKGRAGNSSERASKCCFYALAGDVVGKEPPTRPWMGTLGHCRNEKAARQSLFNPTK